MRRVIKIKCSIVFVLVLTTFQSFSQVEFNLNKKKIKPTFFDTSQENIFVYENASALIYFKQTDILNFLNKPLIQQAMKTYGYTTLQDTLSKGVKQIKVNNILFGADMAQRDSLLQQNLIPSFVLKTNEEFFFICAGVLLEGNFMLYSNHKNKFISKSIVAKKTKGIMGREDLVFYMPGKKIFYFIVLSLGE